MRKSVLAVSGLAVAGMILMTSVLSQSGTVSWQPFQTTREAVEYSSQSGRLDTSTLPAPGILPDNPLYPAKMIRDRLRIWLTREPMARAELYVYLAEKRSETALHLAAKKQIQLSQATMRKAYQYLEAATNLLNQQADETASNQEIRLRIRQALEQHLTRLSLMALEVEGNARISYERIKENYQVLLLSSAGR